MSFLYPGSATPGLSELARCTGSATIEVQWFSSWGEGAGLQRSGEDLERDRISDPN